MRAARIRVLHLVDNLNFGGMERIIAELVRRADHDRFEVHVLGLSYLGHFSTELEGVADLHTATPMSRMSILRPARLAHDIARIAPDVAHVHSGVWFKAARAARIARVPRIVYTDHGRQYPDPWLHRALDRYASRKTDAVVAVSDALRRHLTRFVAHPGRVMVIPNGVDTDQMPAAGEGDSLRAELGIAPDAPVLGSVGRLEPVKGYEVMLAAFALFAGGRASGPPPALVLVGDGSERARLEQQAAELGISHLVHFRGWQTNIQRHLAACDLFTMSSHSEGTSVSLLEAMSAGLCPVVTRVGGNEAVLGNDLAHRLVPPDDPAALGAAWSSALADAQQLACDGAAARARVVEAYSLTGMVNAYQTLYTRLASG